MDRQEERRKKRIRRTNRIRLIIFAGLLALALIVGLSVKNVVDLKLEQGRLQKENVELKEKKAKLEQELKSINDNNYIEEQARKQLNMVKPGEIVYIIEDEDKKKEDD